MSLPPQKVEEVDTMNAANNALHQKDIQVDGIIEKAFSNVLRTERNAQTNISCGITLQNQKNVGSAQRAHNHKFR